VTNILKKWDRLQNFRDQSVISWKFKKTNLQSLKVIGSIDEIWKINRNWCVHFLKHMIYESIQKNYKEQFDINIVWVKF